MIMITITIMIMIMIVIMTMIMIILKPSPNTLGKINLLVSKKVHIITENYVYGLQTVRCAPSVDHVNAKQASRACLSRESDVREADESRPSQAGIACQETTITREENEEHSITSNDRAYHA